MTPRRVQRKRSKGWSKPEGCILCTRPSKYGNPYRIVRYGGRWWVAYRNDPQWKWALAASRADALAHAVYSHRRDLLAGHLNVTVEDVKRDLKGRDLGCWCPCEDLCHVDTLLEIANG